MTLTTLMQVMLAIGAYYLVIGYTCTCTLGVSKAATTRTVYRVSKGVVNNGKRHCMTPNVGCEGSCLYNVAGTYKISNYPHRMLYPTLNAAITNELIFWKRCFVLGVCLC